MIRIAFSDLCCKYNVLTVSNERLHSESGGRQEKLLSTSQALEILQLYRDTTCIQRQVTSHYVRERKTAQVYQWDWSAKFPGIKLGVILPQLRVRKMFKVFAKWNVKLPFGLSQIVRAQLNVQDYFPSIPKLSLRPRRIISVDSEIILACEASDILKIQDLLTSRQAHPNDRTPDNLTVFRVGFPAG